MMIKNIILYTLICFCFFSCKSVSKEELIQEQIKIVDNKLATKDYLIKLDAYIPRTGKFTNIQDKSNSYIQVKSSKIEFVMPDIATPEKMISQSSTWIDYSLQKKEDGLTLISGNFYMPSNQKKYSVSMLISSFGDVTIYLSEGFYNSISFVGVLQ